MMRLNLGSADRYVPGWVNVDQSGCPHPADQIVDLTGPLPWQPGEVDAIYCGHLLEHLPFTAAEDLLRRLLVCAAPGAEIMAVGPDIDAATTMAMNGEHLEVPLFELIGGGRRWPGDEHRWPCTPALLVHLLTAAGWDRVTDVGIGNVGPRWPVAVPNLRWQCAVSARKAQ